MSRKDKTFVTDKRPTEKEKLTKHEGLLYSAMERGDQVAVDAVLPKIISSWIKGKQGG